MTSHLTVVFTVEDESKFADMRQLLTASMEDHGSGLASNGWAVTGCAAGSLFALIEKIELASENNGDASASIVSDLLSAPPSSWSDI